MVTNRTFTMLKPDSVEKGNIGAILEKITAVIFSSIAPMFPFSTESGFNMVNVLFVTILINFLFKFCANINLF